jgi:hypothetical protein
MLTSRALRLDRGLWTPPQWRKAFPAVALLFLLLDAQLVWASVMTATAIAAIGGGVLAGLYVSLAWTLWPLIPLFSLLLVAAAVVALTATWLAVPAALFGAAAVATAVALVWVLGYHVGYTGAIARARMLPLERFGPPAAARRCLIVHHPGRSGYQTQLHRAFAATLAAEGWHVDLVSAHEGNRVDAANYDLMMFGAPCYNFRPARPLLDYLQRLPFPAGQRVGVVLTGGGRTESAMRWLQRELERRGAHVVAALEIWTSRPHVERHGLDDPFEIARRAARTSGALFGSDPSS